MSNSDSSSDGSRAAPAMLIACPMSSCTAFRPNRNSPVGSIHVPLRNTRCEMKRRKSDGWAFESDDKQEGWSSNSVATKKSYLGRKKSMRDLLGLH